MSGDTGALSRRECLCPTTDRYHPKLQYLRGKVGSSPLLLRAHLQGYQELRDLDAFPKNQLLGVPRHVTCQTGSRDAPALSIPTWRGGNQDTLGTCSSNTRAPDTWVNKGLRGGCFGFRRRLLPPMPGEEPESRGVLRPAPPPRAKVGPEAPPLGRPPACCPRREPPSSAGSLRSGPSGIPFTAFPLGPDLGDPRRPSSWCRFCAVGPSWPPAASSSAPGE